MFAWLWNSFTGYVMISVEGLSLEKFLNLTAQANVKIWDVRRLSYTKLTACVARTQFRKLRPVLRSLRCRVHIETKLGVPFRLAFLRLRKALLFGGVLCVLALAAAGSFVWDVRVEGNVMVPAETVLSAVAPVGAKRFVLRRDLDMLRISGAATAADSRIAWAGARLRGTQLVIEVVESAQEPRMVDKETPADIVALRDAVVSELTVLEGVASVQENAPVRAGDILISGTIPHEGAAPRLVHARGEVMGRVWYNASARIGAYRIVPQRTGKEQVSIRISIAGWEIDLAGKEKYDRLEAEPIRRERISSLFLPAYYTREKQFEVVLGKEPLDQQQMMTASREMALSKLNKLVSANSTILGITTKYTPLEDSLLCEMIAEAEEKIGVTKPVSEVEQNMGEELEAIDTVP